MVPEIPSAEQIRDVLRDLTIAQIEQLAEASGVPVSTIYKVKIGVTVNPGIETVRKFMPHLRSMSAADAKAA